MRIRSVLVPLDFSDSTEAVLSKARRLAAAFHARIRLIHVGRESRRTGGMEFELPEYVRLVKAQNEAARAQLEQCAKRLRREGFRADVSFAEGDARRSILQVAHELDPAAIVLGAHPHGALHDILRNGVRRSLLKESAWPVMVVPPDRTQSDC